MVTREFVKDNLQVKVFDSRAEMGRGAASDAVAYLKQLMAEQEVVNIIFAAAPSQNEFLATMVDSDVDWSRVNAFHMDEYIGLPSNAPQGFGNFLHRAIFGKVPFRSVNYINGQNVPEDTLKQYKALLKENKVDIVFMGIGENGHIAFNDPHVADFSDPELIKVVDLDEKCRRQQVNDGCFSCIEDVPTHAFTLTVPALMAAKRRFCVVPASTKAQAVYNTINGDVSEACPASVLRMSEGTTLYLDSDSSSLL